MTGIGFAAPWVLAIASAALLPIIAHLARHEDRAGSGFPSLMFLSRVPFPFLHYILTVLRRNW